MCDCRTTITVVRDKEGIVVSIDEDHNWCKKHAQEKLNAIGFSLSIATVK